MPDKRIIIRGLVNRIQDIENDLLAKNRDIKNSDGALLTGDSGLESIQLMSSLLESIVTEKRMQYRSKLGIEIEFNPGKNNYGLFVKIWPDGFKRVISNAVNNAIEALGETGIIEMLGKNNFVEVKIKDNGKGIPPEVLAKLGQLEETHGKDGGNGLGPYHAKKSVESWNGLLFLESELGVGTTLTIKVPQMSALSWFVPELKLIKDGNIVILDDDSTKHQIWDRRFLEAGVKEKGLSVFHLSTPEQVED